VLDLNLDGTELVVLSACDTAQGSIDYGDGVSGLVRALRTAGARAVLVTLRPVNDMAAADFMKRFYGHWLGDARGDASTALRLTQQGYVKEQTDFRTPAGDDAQQDRGGKPVTPPATTPTAAPTWASFILIGG
jgi:CHAT domain-containing protein